MEVTRKLFTEKQIGFSAFFGGPVPPGILIYINLIRLNREKEAYFTLAITLIFSVIMVYGLIAFPQNVYEKIPSQLIPTVIGLLVWLLYHFFIAKHSKKELEIGTGQESNWTVAGFSFIGIVLFLGIAIGIGFLEPPYPGEKLTFDGNEIYFDEKTSKKDIEILADQLMTRGYFAREYQNVARLETWETRCIVTLPIVKDFWEDVNTISELQSMKWILEVEMEKEVTIVLEHYELNGNRKTKSL